MLMQNTFIALCLHFMVSLSRLEVIVPSSSSTRSLPIELHTLMLIPATSLQNSMPPCPPSCQVAAYLDTFIPRYLYVRTSTELQPKHRDACSTPLRLPHRRTYLVQYAS